LNSSKPNHSNSDTDGSYLLKFQTKNSEKQPHLKNLSENTNFQQIKTLAINLYNKLQEFDLNLRNSLDFLIYRNHYLDFEILLNNKANLVTNLEKNENSN